MSRVWEIWLTPPADQLDLAQEAGQVLEIPDHRRLKLRR